MNRLFVFLCLLVATSFTSAACAQQVYSAGDQPGSISSIPISNPGYSEYTNPPTTYEPYPYAWQEQASGQAAGGQAGTTGGQIGEYGGHVDEDTYLHRFVTPLSVANPSVGAGGGGAGGGGQAAGAGAAVNPGVPLAQFQFQNSFIPESYGSSGYSNVFVVQPVIPITLKPGRYFEYHIVRPTLSIVSPVPNPDGPVDDTKGGIGDLVALDLYFHTIKKGLVWGIGPIYSFPTSTNRQTGLGEWQLGPSIALLDSRKKGWVTGFLLQVPFSLESDAYSATLQPVLTKLLKEQWYFGWGDLAMTIDDQNGNYNLPLSMRVGRVVKAGKQPINIFVQPQWTPSGLTSLPSANYGLKLSVSFLLPGAEFGYSKEKAAKRRCRQGCRGCHRCR